MRYPVYQNYEQLYARFFQRSPAELLEGIELEGKKLLDVCAGNGRLSIYAASKGAIVTYLDQEHNMTPFAELRERNIRMEHVSIKDYLDEKSTPKFDIIACQQGINYWLDDREAGKLWDHMNVGGIVVFNTFNKEPSQRPVVKEYDQDGHHFVEVSYMTSDHVVHHMQARDGLPMHTTEFTWLPRNEIGNILGRAGFRSTEDVKGATSIWKGVRL